MNLYDRSCTRPARRLAVAPGALAVKLPGQAQVRVQIAAASRNSMNVMRITCPCLSHGWGFAVNGLRQT
jgi:hypothetical protein